MTDVKPDAAQEVEKEEKGPLGLKEYFEDKLDGESFDIRCYRCTRGLTGGREEKTYLTRYQDRYPTEEEIGEEFGGGNFQLVCKYEGQTFTKRVNIDSLYTEKLNRKRMREEQAATVAAAPPKQDNSLEMIAKVAEIVSKLQGAKSEESKLPNMMRGVMDVFTDSMGKMQRSLINQQVESIKAMGQKDEPKKDNSALVESVLGVIQQFGEMYLNSKGKQSDLMRQMIENDPRFQEAAEDQDALQEIFEVGSAMPDIGPDKMQALFHKMDLMDSPQQSEDGAAAAEGASPEEPQPAAPHQTEEEPANG